MIDIGSPRVCRQRRAYHSHFASLRLCDFALIRGTPRRKGAKTQRLKPHTLRHLLKTTESIRIGKFTHLRPCQCDTTSPTISRYRSSSDIMPHKLRACVSVSHPPKSSRFPEWLHQTGIYRILDGRLRRERPVFERSFIIRYSPLPS